MTPFSAHGSFRTARAHRAADSSSAARPLARSPTRDDAGSEAASPPLIPPDPASPLHAMLADERDALIVATIAVGLLLDFILFVSWC